MERPLCRLSLTVRRVGEAGQMIDSGCGLGKAWVPALPLPPSCELLHFSEPQCPI